LDADDFKPLLISAFIFDTKLLRRFNAAHAAILLASIPCEIGGLTLTFHFTTLNPIILILVATVIAFPFIVILPYSSQRIRLTADKMAAYLVGADNFLVTLRKIDELQCRDIEKRKGSKWMRLRSYVPSITERIKTLESTQQQG